MKKLVILFYILIFVSIISSCFSLLGDGSNTLIKESANNKQSKKAVLFLREGATTVGESYQISITDYKTEFDTVAVGNAFTFDGNHGKANLNPKVINFNWISDDTIEISYDKKLRTFIQEKNINGVTIVYKLK